MNWTELVQDEAKKHGIELDDDTAGYVLWNHTGFPDFWDGPAVECCRLQVKEWCEENDRR